MRKKILITAGESSGDLHAGNLIRAMRRLAPEIEFYGMGGVEMRSAGARITHDLRQVSVIGLVEVLRRLPTILRVLRELGAGLKSEKPDLAILVDFPDFNLRLAEKIKRAGIPVLWYISPQVWAWRAERIPKIARLIDHMLVILPFEVDFYRRYDMNVHFVGHPLIDIVKSSMTPAETRARCGIEEDAPIIALLPGSRQIELKLLLPHLCRAAEILYAADKRRRFIIPVANSLSPDPVRRITEKADAPISVVSGFTYDCISAAQCAVVAAGTATLETALLGTPEIIIGRVGRLTWILWSRHTHLPYYGLPNYILGEKLITELIQHQATGEEIARRVEHLLASNEERERLTEGCKRIRERLGSGGASERAAQAALAILSGEAKSYALVGKDK